MFQFPALALRIGGVTGLQPDRLSHSEIPGSKIICIYPGLIAAYHVLHRLCEPRHPPCALSYFLYYDTLSFPLPRMRAPLILSAVLLCEIKFLSLGNLFYFTSTVLSCFNMSKISILACTLRCFEVLVENNGFEPLTPCLQSRCSSQLS